MAKSPGAIPTNLRPRRAPVPTAEKTPKQPFNALKFWREVQAEARKVTWTSWKETWITSVMVGIMVVIAALFFFAVDGVFGVAVNWVLKLFGGTGL
jgi:preprotein translocase subunit SecE